MPSIYSKVQSASTLSVINRSKKKNSSVLTNMHQWMTSQLSWRSFTNRGKLGGRARRPERIRSPIMDPREHQKRDSLWKSSNSFMKRPKRSSKSWTGWNMNTVTAWRKKTQNNSTWITSLSKRWGENWKIVTTTVLQAVPWPPIVKVVQVSTWREKWVKRRWLRPEWLRLQATPNQKKSDVKFFHWWLHVIICR